MHSIIEPHTCTVRLLPEAHRPCRGGCCACAMWTVAFGFALVALLHNACSFLSSEAGPTTAGTEGPQCLMAAGRGTMLSQRWTRCWTTCRNSGLSQRARQRLPAQRPPVASAATAHASASSAPSRMRQVAPLFPCATATTTWLWSSSAGSLTTRCCILRRHLPAKFTLSKGPAVPVCHCYGCVALELICREPNHQVLRPQMPVPVWTGRDLTGKDFAMPARTCTLSC